MKKKVFLILSLLSFMFLDVSKAFASSQIYEFGYITYTGPLTMVDNGATVDLRHEKGEYAHVVVYRDSVLVEEYNTDINNVGFRIFLYDIEYFTQGDFYVELQRSGGSYDVIEFSLVPVGSVPYPEPEPEPNYTNVLNAINGNLGDVKNVLNNNHAKAMTELSAMKYLVSDGFHLLNQKADQTNAHLSSIDGTLKAINNNLNTTKQPANKVAPDFSNELEKNRPVQRTDPFFDNQKYFEESQHNIIADDMPDMMEPKQWQGVSAPVQLETELELLPEPEQIRELEILRETEKVSDIFELSPELTKEEMRQDLEMTREENQRETELVKDVFESDAEMQKDEFQSTENYTNSDYYNQTEKYEADLEDYSLRWKSVKGVFQ